MDFQYWTKPNLEWNFNTGKYWKFILTLVTIFFWWFWQKSLNQIFKLIRLSSWAFPLFCQRPLFPAPSDIVGNHWGVANLLKQDVHLFLGKEIVEKYWYIWFNSFLLFLAKFPFLTLKNSTNFLAQNIIKTLFRTIDKHYMLFSLFWFEFYCKDHWNSILSLVTIFFEWL